MYLFAYYTRNMAASDFSAASITQALAKQLMEWKGRMETARFGASSEKLIKD